MLALFIPIDSFLRVYGETLEEGIAVCARAVRGKALLHHFIRPL